MIFKKEYLLALLDEPVDDATVILDDLVGTSRWSLRYRLVFRAADGKHYETFYSRGKTEDQDEQPYQYDGDDIECAEVVPVEKAVTVYERPQ